MKRLTFFLNIGTDVAGRPDADLSQQTRTVKALAELAGAGDYSHTVALGAPYKTDDGTERRETTIVARVVTTYDVAAWGELLYRVSVRLRQDCISCSPDNGNTGDLIGPGAAEYGQFNPAYFVPYTGANAK